MSGKPQLTSANIYTGTQMASVPLLSSTQNWNRIWLDLFDDLHDVLVLEHVLFPDFLGPVLCGGAPHQGIFELPDHAAVDLVAKVFHAAVLLGQHHGLVVVWQPAL